MISPLPKMSDDVVRPFAGSPAHREAMLRGDREELRRLWRESIRKAWIDLAAPAIAKELGVTEERAVELLSAPR